MPVAVLDDLFLESGDHNKGNPQADTGPGGFLRNTQQVHQVTVPVHILGQPLRVPCGEGGFPLIAVPGEDLPHAFPLGENGYLKSGGTSFAAGLLGGAAALLLQAAPDLEPWELEALLIETARDLRPEGTDTDSGAGSIDLEAAFRQLKEEGRVQPPRP